MKKIDGWVTAPQGFLAAGVKAGIKASGNHDVAVIYSTVPASTGAVFTQNKMCAAPVLLSREVAQESVAQAIIVNSGCANACTGEQGLLDAREMQAFAADLLGIEPSAFSGAASTAFSVGTSISTLPPINTLSSSFGFSVSGFSIRVTLTVVLDTWPLSTGAINAVYT